MINTAEYGKKMKSGMSFPNSTDVSDYYRLALEYIYSAWSSRSMRSYFSAEEHGAVCGIHDRSFAELRAYGRAAQSASKYMDILDPADPDGNRSEGLMNISWSNAKFFLKFRDIMWALITENQFDPVVQALDKASDREKRMVAAKMKFDRHPKVQQLAAMVGTKPNEPREFAIIESDEDVDMLYKMGGILLASEILLKDNMDTVFVEDLPGIAERWADDIIDLNLAVGILEYCSEKRRPVLRYSDPQLCIIQHSPNGDHEDDQVFGHMMRVPVSSLVDKFSQEDMQKIYDQALATKPTQMEVTRKDYNKAVQNNFDNLHVWVLKGYWIDDESEKFITGMRSNGVMVHDKVGMDSKLSGRDVRRGKEFVTYNTQYVYKGCWIVGTQYTYDTGKDNLIVRSGKPGKKKACLPVVIHDGNTESLVGRCIADIDDIQLAILKRRHLISKMIPGPRMAIDKSKMNDDIQIGKSTYSILEAAELFPRTGMFIYSSRGEFEDQNGAQRPPIDFLPSGIAEDLNIMISEIRDKLDSIRQQIGINEVTDGSSQTQDMLNGVMQGMMQATNNAMARTIRGYANIHDRMAKLLGSKLVSAIISDQMELEELENSGVWGKELLTKSLFDGSFRFSVSARPSQQARQMLLADVTQYKNNNMVAPEVYYMIIKMIQDGDLQKAQLFMSKAIQRKVKQDYEMELQRIQETAKANGQTAVMSEQARQQTIQLEGQQKLAQMEKDLEIALKKIQEEGRVKNELLDKEIQVREMRYNQRV